MSSALEPVWNMPIKEYDRALDPLGMNRVNDRMIGELVQGFTSLTLRARYYVFYTWAINHIRKKNLTKNFTQFSNALYGLERLYMLSCVDHKEIKPNNNHDGISGVKKGREIWLKNLDEIPLNFTFFGNKNKLGGYGQYYERSMLYLGLIKWDEDGYEKPTELGLDTIKHFDKLATQSGILSDYVKLSIPRNKLKKMGEKICLCKLKEQKAEKNILSDVFFGFSGLDTKFSKARQGSFALILSVIEQVSKQNHAIDSQDFLDAAYFGEIQTEKNPVKVSIPPRLFDISKRWKIVKAHDNLSLVTESILQSFLGFLNPSNGRTLEEFFHLIFKKFDDELEILLNDLGGNFADEPIQKIISCILGKNSVACDWNDIAKTSERFDNAVSLSSKLSENLFVANLEALIQEQNPNPSKIVTNGVVLVLLTALRLSWKMNPNEDSARWLKQLQREDPGILEFTGFVKKTIKQNVATRDFTREFIQKYVISQAERIYRDKFHSSTNPKLWFHKKGSNYVKDRDYWARHRNIRFESAISILHDLDLVNSLDDVLECTDSGRKMLERVLGVR